MSKRRKKSSFGGLGSLLGAMLILLVALTVYYISSDLTNAVPADADVPPTLQSEAVDSQSGIQSAQTSSEGVTTEETPSRETSSQEELTPSSAPSKPDESTQQPAPSQAASSRPAVSSSANVSSSAPSSSSSRPTSSTPSQNTSSASSSTSSNTGATSLETANRTTKGSEKYPYYIMVNRSQNLVIVYAMDADGYYTVPHKAFVCSTGLPDEKGVVHTPTGTFNTTDQYTWRALDGGVYGQYATRIVNHILFHSVPYFKKDKTTLEWEEYNKLGQAASLGCIRLTVEDAKWIYDNCPSGTTVTIYDSDRTEPFAKPTADKIPESSNNKGWDPTDPDPKNPWNA